jgi:DNA polymerase III alpha subunit (gram-positive type)
MLQIGPHIFVTKTPNINIMNQKNNISMIRPMTRPMTRSMSRSMTITKPIRNGRVLIFDTETNGKIPKQYLTVDELPHILQLSFVVYNTVTNHVEEVFDGYIKVKPEVEIPQKTIDINGVTREICEEKGIHIIKALCHFYNAFISCDCVVAHNYEFDSQMILIEIQRNLTMIEKYAPYCVNIFNPSFGVYSYCTMNNSKSAEICNDVRVKRGDKTIRWPKLIELYQCLFQETPENLHNSIVDVLVCMRCYLKIRYNTDIDPIAYSKLVANALS